MEEPYININNPENSGNSLKSYSDERDEYIRSLEMSVQLLQREVEHLRNQDKPHQEITGNNNSAEPDGKTQGLKQYNFHNCTTFELLLDRLLEITGEKYSVFELKLYKIYSDGKIHDAVQPDTISELDTNIKRLEEEGVIDWSVENRKISIIPNLAQPESEPPTFFLLMPLYLRDSAIAILIAKTSLSPNDLGGTETDELNALSEYIAIAFDNINSANEITSMNNRLSALGTQIQRTSRLASIGEIASSIAREIENPLNIIKANLQFIESGLGDTKRRFEIINEQVSNIGELNSRLLNISEPSPGEIKMDRIRISGLIDEVLLFSGSQLKRDGIIILKECENDNLEISGIKPQLEHAFLNLFLFLRDTMPDGGTIDIGIYKGLKTKISITISDNGRGLTEQEIKEAFEPSPNSGDSKITSVYFVREIINQHNGSISLVSEPGRGSTFKITFPALKQ